MTFSIIIQLIALQWAICAKPHGQSLPMHSQQPKVIPTQSSAILAPTTKFPLLYFLALQCPAILVAWNSNIWLLSLLRSAFSWSSTILCQDHCGAYHVFLCSRIRLLCCLFNAWNSNNLIFCVSFSILHIFRCFVCFVLFHSCFCQESKSITIILSWPEAEVNYDY